MTKSGIGASIVIAIALAIASATAACSLPGDEGALTLLLRVPDMPFEALGSASKAVIPGTVAVRVTAEWEGGGFTRTIPLSAGQNTVEIGGVPSGKEIMLAVETLDSAGAAFSRADTVATVGVPVTARLAPAGVTPATLPAPDVPVFMDRMAFGTVRQARVTGIPLSGYWHFVTNPEMAGLVWLDCVDDAGARIEAQCADRNEGWLVLDASTLPDDGMGGKYAVFTIAAFAPVRDASDMGPSISLYRRAAFFVEPGSAGAATSPSDPGSLVTTIVTYRTNPALPPSVFLRSGTYELAAFQELVLTVGQAYLYGGLSADWRTVEEGSAIVTTVGATTANSLVIGDPGSSSNASAVLDGLTVVVPRPVDLEAVGLYINTTGWVVVSDCDIRPAAGETTPHNRQRTAARVATVTSIPDGRKTFLRCSFRAGASENTGGMTNNGLFIGLEAGEWVGAYGCRFDAGDVTCTTDNGASTCGIQLTGSGGELYLAGNRIWGGMAGLQNSSATTASANGLLSYNTSARVLLLSNVIAGGTVKGYYQNKADGCGAYFASSMNVYLMHNVFVAPHSALTGAKTLYATKVNSTGSDVPFMANAAVAGTGTGFALANVGTRPLSPCARNAVYHPGGQDASFALPADNLDHDDWHPATDFVSFAGYVGTYSQFLAADFRWNASARGKVGSWAFMTDAASIPVRDLFFLFQFLRFDAAGKLRPESAAWTVGAYQ